MNSSGENPAISAPRRPASRRDLNAFVPDRGVDAGLRHTGRGRLEPHGDRLPHGGVLGLLLARLSVSVSLSSLRFSVYNTFLMSAKTFA